eukprot:1898774-Amphidinium_carterae.1
MSKTVYTNAGRKHVCMLWAGVLPSNYRYCTDVNNRLARNKKACKKNLRGEYHSNKNHYREFPNPSLPNPTFVPKI